MIVNESVNDSEQVISLPAGSVLKKKKINKSGGVNGGSGCSYMGAGAGAGSGSLSCNNNTISSCKTQFIQ